MSSTNTPYQPRDYPRVCDECGVPYFRSKLTKRSNGLFYCPDDVDRWTALEKSKIEAQARKPRIKPVRDAQPKAEVDRYQVEEGRILSFLAQQATSAGIVQYRNVTNGVGARYGSASALATGWVGIYLYKLIAENKRPADSINLAKSLLKTCAAALMATQATDTPTDIRYGSFAGSGPSAGNWSAEDTSVGGLTLLYAYRVFGDGAYLSAAKMAATSLRHLQCCDIYDPAVTAFSTTPDNATAHHYGPWLHGVIELVNGVIPNPDWRFFPSDMVGIRFLTELLTTDGDSIYGSEDDLGQFSAPPAGLLSAMITECRAFWASSVGAYDRNIDKTFNGFSVAGMTREFYSVPYQTNVSGTGAFWSLQLPYAGTGITGSNFSNALWALYQCEGYSDQVASVWTWLMSATSNPSFKVTGAMSDSSLANSTAGSYNPALSIALTIDTQDINTSATVNRNGVSIYDWSCVGLLAEIQAVRSPGAFKTAIDALSKRDWRYHNGNPYDSQLDSVSLRGQTGLSMQMAFTQQDINGVLTPPPDGAALLHFQRFHDAVAAAKAGLAYRLASQAISGPSPEYV